MSGSTYDIQQITNSAPSDAMQTLQDAIGSIKISTKQRSYLFLLEKKWCFFFFSGSLVNLPEDDVCGADGGGAELPFSFIAPNACVSGAVFAGAEDFAAVGA